jgi:hypothetical protein
MAETIDPTLFGFEQSPNYSLLLRSGSAPPIQIGSLTTAERRGKYEGHSVFRILLNGLLVGRKAAHEEIGGYAILGAIYFLIGGSC